MSCDLDNFDVDIARNDQLITNLRDQLAKARSKVASAKRNIVGLEARNEGAKIRRELAKASSEFNAGNSPLAALDELEKEVNATEVEAEAWEEITGDTDSSKDLEAKYGNGSSSDVEDELKRMMEASKSC